MSAATIRIEVTENGQARELELPADINLSLMEILKASDYPILATCGGMALCATCHVEVSSGIERLPEPTEQELAMIDTLPDATSLSRLACQIRLSPSLDGVKLRLAGTA